MLKVGEKYNAHVLIDHHIFHLVKLPIIRCCQISALILLLIYCFLIIQCVEINFAFRCCFSLLENGLGTTIVYLRLWLVQFNIVLILFLGGFSIILNSFLHSRSMLPQYCSIKILKTILIKKKQKKKEKGNSKCALCTLQEIIHGI